MRIALRQGLIKLLVLGLSLSLFPCRAALAQALNTQEQALHVLNRLAYGPRPGDIAAVEKLGIKTYIEQQLNPERIPVPEDLQHRLDGLATYQLTTAQLYRQYGPPSFPPNSASPEEKEAARQRAAKEITPQSHLARLWLATESPRQLQEVMTEFWFNHFTIFEGKEWDRYWIADYEKNVIRPNALGNFRELLGAVAHHPAMLYYLDNWLSSGVNTVGAKGRYKGLNENYARELMELHTLGVDGGYSQADVIALARMLSGWTIDIRDPKNGNGEGDASFIFNPQRHDNGTKQFLGHAIPPDGQREGELALDMLAQSPATAYFIATKLARYFVADQPDPLLVQQLAQRFQSSHGDIKAVLRLLLNSPQFWSRKNYQSQFKTPYQYVISALRASATPVINGKPVSSVLNQFGMPLYGWLTPEGYAFSEEAWLNPDALLRRINFASSLSNGKSSIARAADSAAPANVEAVDPVRLIQTLAPLLSQSEVTTISTSPVNLQVGLILGSPAFMKR